MNFIKGVGIDIAKVPRFSRLLEQKYINNFLNKALHPIEIEEISKLKNDQKPKYLASRWSYKEALVKASGKKGIIFSKCFLKKNESGKPFIEFDEDYKQSDMDIKQIAMSLHVSLSHEDDISVAIVIIEKENNKF